MAIIPNPEDLYKDWQAGYGTPAGDTLASCWECSRAYWGSYYGRPPETGVRDVGRALQHCGLCPSAWAGDVLVAAGGTGYELPPQAEPVGGWGDRYLFHPDPNEPISKPAILPEQFMPGGLGFNVSTISLLIGAAALWYMFARKKRGR